MALDDIVKGEVLEFGGSTGALKSVLTRVQEGQGPSDINSRARGNLGHGERDLIIKYLIDTNETDMTPAEIQEILRDRRLTEERKTEIFLPYLPQAYEHFKGDLVDKVSQDDNYGEMISNIEGESLLGIALSVKIPENLQNEQYSEVIESKKEYDKWSEKSKQGDTDAYLESLHPAFRALLASTDDEGERLFSNDDLEEYLQLRTSFHQGQFFSGIGIDVEKYSQGQRSRNQELKDSAVNEESVRNYIGTISEGLEEDQKPALYEETGIAYANHLAQENLNRQNAEYQRAVA